MNPEQDIYPLPTDLQKLTPQEAEERIQEASALISLMAKALMYEESHWDRSSQHYDAAQSKICGLNSLELRASRRLQELV